MLGYLAVGVAVTLAVVGIAAHRPKAFIPVVLILAAGLTIRSRVRAARRRRAR